MQFMPPEIPAAFFASTSDPNYQRLAPKLQALVDDAVAAGMNGDCPFSVTVLDGVVQVDALDGELVASGSVDEVNALAAPELPEVYLSSEQSLSDDKHYSEHLVNHWGF